MAKKKVLIVDDEPGYSYVLKIAFEATNRYDVRVETVATRTLQAAKEFIPDVILLDVMMPELSGGAVARQILDDGITQKIPIIFLTASISSEEAVSKGGIVGGRRFISKMFKSEEIIKYVDKVIDSAK